MAALLLARTLGDNSWIVGKPYLIGKGRVARDTTKCAGVAQQCVARRRSQLTTVDTVADTAIAHVGCNGTSPKGNAHLRSHRGGLHAQSREPQKQAKLILRWHRERHYPVAAQIREHLPRFLNMPDSEILAASFKLSDAQEMIARQQGFDSWQA